MTKNYICAEDAIDNIKNMMDYDGFRDGDCVSRRAVIGILDSMKTEIICGIDFASTSEETKGCITFIAKKGRDEDDLK